MSENSSVDVERPRFFYDPNSLSSFNAYRIIHSHFDWTVDFESKILLGSVRLDLQGLKYSSCDISSTITTAHAEIPNRNGQQLVLDARHLDVKEVLFNDASLPFQVDPERETLIIEMPSKLADERGSVQIVYSTSKSQCTALQWLTKEQTADREQPYMFSQCQAIHARSLYPCQDTPGVKSTYSAQITCPKPLTVVSSFPFLEREISSHLRLADECLADETRRRDEHLLLRTESSDSFVSVGDRRRTARLGRSQREDPCLD